MHLHGFISIIQVNIVNVFQLCLVGELMVLFQIKCFLRIISVEKWLAIAIKFVLEQFVTIAQNFILIRERLGLSCLCLLGTENFRQIFETCKFGYCSSWLVRMLSTKLLQVVD